MLGEGASQLDTGVKERFSDVEWFRPSDLRNRIVHGYWTIGGEILRATVTHDLPGFVTRLRGVLAQRDAKGDL